ncbi:MAG: hypothetical protein M5R38_14070 [Candidatus Methylomirabilis sp.]|nr:hypothetical protein [Candidatus Methylomirabilis sp.]
MASELFPKLITLLAFTTLGTAFLLIVGRDLAGQVRLLAAQSLTLAIAAAVVAAFTSSAELAGVAAVLGFLKVFVIPRVLNRAVTKIGLQPAALPYLGTPATLVVCGGLVTIAFYVMAPVAAANPLPTAEAIPIAFAGVFIGFFVMVNRRRALTQILGFLMLEQQHLSARTADHVWGPVHCGDGGLSGRVGSGLDYGGLRLSHQREL